MLLNNFKNLVVFIHLKAEMDSLGSNNKYTCKTLVSKARVLTCGLYYKPMMIINDYSRVINKLEATLADDAIVIIYNRLMFKVQATD